VHGLVQHFGVDAASCEEVSGGHAHTGMLIAACWFVDNEVERLSALMQDLTSQDPRYRLKVRAFYFISLFHIFILQLYFISLFYMCMKRSFASAYFWSQMGFS
jgi:hypothetical protein